MIPTIRTLFNDFRHAFKKIREENSQLISVITHCLYE
jgi:hypothetical protein